MKKSTLLISRLCAIMLLAAAMNVPSYSQFRDGAFSLNAGMSMPSGLTLSAGIPSSTIVNVSYTYSFASSIGYVVMQNLQLEAGVSYVNASFTVPSGNTAIDNQTLFSLYLGGKFFLMPKEMVMPYIGAGFSFTSMPTVKTGNDSETSGKLTTVLGYFGAMSFINKERTIALFIQMGLGFNSGTVSSKYMGKTTDNGQTNITLGGSAFGGSIYF